MSVTSPCRRRASLRGLVAIAVAATFALAVTSAARADGSAAIVPGGNPVRSALLGQWLDRYLELPVADNPAYGNGDPCQRLAGGTVLGPIVQVGTEAAFACTVRFGTPVFLLGFAAECDNRTLPISEDEASQLACARGFLSGVQSTRYTIDGRRPVELHARAFETSTHQRRVTLPPDNIAGVEPGPETYTGYGWAAIALLGPGRHTIRHDVESDLFTGTSSYTVVVTPRGAR